jgi:NAD(P)-dependent dehydrogenase (short-subunit alcohol dehydrogenase family)
MSDLANRIIIVTGGAKGLGKVFASECAERGAHVAIGDIAPLDEAVSAIEAAGAGAVFAQPLDVADETSVVAFVQAVQGRFGRVDGLVNNAAIYAGLPVAAYHAIDGALWDQVMAVNVKGPFLMAKHVAPIMADQGGGKIVNIGSGVAYKGMPGMLHYVASKGAVTSMTRALSRELGEDNICVNTLAPGLTLSESIVGNEEHVAIGAANARATRAFKRDAHPSDLVGALAFLLSSDSDFITGQTIAVDGGSVNL